MHCSHTPVILDTRFITRSFLDLNWYKNLTWMTLQVLVPRIPRGSDFQDSEGVHRQGRNDYWWFDEWLNDLIREQRCTQSRSWHSAVALPLDRLNVQAQAPGNLQQERNIFIKRKKQGNLMMVIWTKALSQLHG